MSIAIDAQVLVGFVLHAKECMALSCTQGTLPLEIKQSKISYVVSKSCVVLVIMAALQEFLALPSMKTT